jgi:hypothetical protein
MKKNQSPPKMYKIVTRNAENRITHITDAAPRHVCMQWNNFQEKREYRSSLNGAVLESHTMVEVQL